MAQPVLHISAKHPQEKHVPENVQKAAMQKHAGHQRHKGRALLRAGVRERTFGANGNEAELLHQQISRTRRKRELIDEDENVRQNQQDIDDREGTAGRLAAKRDHSEFTFYLKYA